MKLFRIETIHYNTTRRANEKQRSYSCLEDTEQEK